MLSLSKLQRMRTDILRLADSHGAKAVRVFGSLARGEEQQTSDVDFLVRMDAERSLLDRIALIHDLEDLLHCKVDVVNERALHYLLRDQILAEGVPL